MPGFLFWRNDAAFWVAIDDVFINENGGGPGVRLRKRHQKKG
jgi:hypothetical protein